MGRPKLHFIKMGEADQSYISCMQQKYLRVELQAG